MKRWKVQIKEEINNRDIINSGINRYPKKVKR